MKRIILSAAFMALFATAVYADGSAFTPLNFNDTSYSIKSSSSSLPSTAPVASTISDEAVGNGNMQNAITQLESAQIDIRNELLNSKTKYADVDAQYKLIKAERQALKKQIKSIQRRINDIDKAKERIKSNML